MHNLTDIRVDFQNTLNQFQTIPPVKILAPKKVQNVKQYIYSWMALPDLIEILKQQIPDTFDEEADRLERFTVRFVVDQHRKPWFALEGELSVSRPAHSDMVNNEPVYSSGNMVFSKDYSTIEEITNKSGHYEPAFGTLVFFLNLLLDLEKHSKFPFRIADQLKLVQYQKKEDCFNPHPVIELLLSKTELENLIQADPRLTANNDYPRIKLRTPNRMICMESRSYPSSSEQISDTDTSGSSEPEETYSATIPQQRRIPNSVGRYSQSLFGGAPPSPSIARKRKETPTVEETSRFFRPNYDSPKKSKSNSTGSALQPSRTLIEFRNWSSVSPQKHMDDPTESRVSNKTPFSPF